MNLLKFELFGMQNACQRKAQLRSSQLIMTGVIRKAISRMCSDKADILSSVAIEMLYSTCIWETGTVTVKIFDLIGNIISRDRTTN